MVKMSTFDRNEFLGVKLSKHEESLLEAHREHHKDIQLPLFMVKSLFFQ